MKRATKRRFSKSWMPTRAGIGELVVTTLTNDTCRCCAIASAIWWQKHIRPYGESLYRPRSCPRRAHGARRHTTDNLGNRPGVSTAVRGIAHYELRQVENGDCVLRFVPDGCGAYKEDLHRVTHNLKRCCILPKKSDRRAMKFCCRRLQENSA